MKGRRTEVEEEFGYVDENEVEGRKNYRRNRYERVKIRESRRR